MPQKNLFKFLFQWIIITFPFLLQAQDLRQFYPRIDGLLVTHTYYALDYAEVHEQASWVIYFAGETGSASRTDRFKPDPYVSTGSANLADYQGSGYDRGHLAPAADMKHHITAMQESFYLSNMSPQDPRFNRGIWKKLEELVRNWAVAANTPNDVIVTGPALHQTCGTIGQKVSVPCFYYKIYVSPDQNRAIAFLLPNEPSSRPLTDYVVSIDSIEAFTGLDFFDGLPDDKENELEKQMNLQDWDWNIRHITQKSNLNDPATTQCSGITQSGNRCKRTINGGSYCWQHQG